jgi:signal transduction histidine kinase
MPAETADWSGRTREKEQEPMNSIELERLSMARDLHDTVVQDFIVVIMQLRRALEKQDTADRLRHTLEGVGAAEEGLSRARGLLQRLRGFAGHSRAPLWGDEAPCFADDLSRILEQVVKHTRLRLDVRCSDSVAIPERVAREVLQIIGEAAHNVVRHAQASRLTCKVEQFEGVFCAEVSDDGVGFAVKRQAFGFGVLGMHERADLIGASLVIDSEPEHGVTVRLAVSVPAAEYA